MNLRLKTIAIAAMLAIAATVDATPLGTEAMTARIDVVPTFSGGTLLASAVTDTSNISQTGLARTAVYLGPTGLDFYDRFSSVPSSVDGVERFGDNAVGSAPTVVSAVPEPETYALLVAGLCAFAVISRRQRQV